MLSLAGSGWSPHRQSLLATQPQSQSTKDPLPHRPKANDEHSVSSAEIWTHVPMLAKPLTEAKPPSASSYLAEMPR
jgi:hypothetical protein